MPQSCTIQGWGSWVSILYSHSFWVKIDPGIINCPVSSHPPPNVWPSRLLMEVRKPLVPMGSTQVTAEAVGAFRMGWGIWVGVWAAFHCITNWHTCKSFKKLTLIILQFPCVRSPDRAWLGPLLRISQGCGQGVGQTVFSSRGQLKKNQLLISFRLSAKFISLWMYDWGSGFLLSSSDSRDSVKLLEAPCQVGLLNTLLTHQASQRSFNPIKGVASQHFTIFYWLEMSHRCCPHWREWNKKRQGLWGWKSLGPP